MKQTSAQSASIEEQINPSSHQQQQHDEVIIPVDSNASFGRRLRPNLPCMDLLKGPREDYFQTVVPLYEASMKGDWKAAKAILDMRPELVKYSITENGETALHIVISSGRRGKEVEIFVQNLVYLMERDDLALENQNFNTAFYFAATSGNVKLVKIMAEKNKSLMGIPGASRQMMPLYAAALFGNHEVVKYLYNISHDLTEDNWTNQNCGWLLEKCVEGDMFDVALQIAKRYPGLDYKNIIGILARKPEAFFDTKSNVFWRTMRLVFPFIGSKMGALEKESNALQLLRIIWEEIVKKPKKEIDSILRGPSDRLNLEKLASGSVQTTILNNLIRQLLNKMDIEIQNIIRDQPEQATGKVDQTNLQLENLISEHLFNMYVESQKIIKQDNTAAVVSGNQATYLGLQRIILELIANIQNDTKNILELKIGKESQARQLQKLFSKQSTFMRAGRFQKETYSSRVLFIAAEKCNTKFVVELIRRYPELSWKVNENNQTIFHIAIKHRHQDIYNLLYEIGTMKDLITPLRDTDENNMLHLAGMRATGLQDVSGVLLQMQQELLWFKEVESIIPPSYRERKNKYGRTPRELFDEEHKDLITQGEKWMKETASQCMVVSTLIATIVFASTFTVPGGYDQNIGIPILYSKPAFIIFVVTDAISLFSSSASILVFLSILTSRFAQSDFLGSLPQKLILGLATLFLSITTMMIAFSVSFFVLYDNNLIWMPILFSMLAFIPVFLYVVSQYKLFTDVMRSTYGFRSLFKLRKDVLYN